MMKFSFSFAQRIPYNVTEYFCHDCRMICWFQIQITCFFTKKILVSYLSPYFMNPTYMLPKNLPSIEMHYIGNLRVVLTLTLQPDLSQTSSLRQKCPNTDIFLSIFSRIRTENGPKKNPYLDNFHAVHVMSFWLLSGVINPSIKTKLRDT